MNENGEFYNKNGKYVVLNSKGSDLKKEEIYLTVLNEEGKTLNEFYFGKSSVISSFKSFENKLYFYGPGGLIELDKTSTKVSKLENKNINDVEFTNNSLYYYHNIGSKEKDGKKYLAEVCEFKKDCFDIEGSVKSIAVLDNRLYIHYSDDLASKGREGKLQIFDLDSKKEISKESLSTYDRMVRWNDKILIIKDNIIEEFEQKK